MLDPFGTVLLLGAAAALAAAIGYDRGRTRTTQEWEARFARFVEDEAAPQSVFVRALTAAHRRATQPAAPTDAQAQVTEKFYRWIMAEEADV